MKSAGNEKAVPGAAIFVLCWTLRVRSLPFCSLLELN
jgi:hypothetical protein